MFQTINFALLMARPITNLRAEVPNIKQKCGQDTKAYDISKCLKKS